MSDINQVVQGIQGFPVSSTAPSVGQALVWDGYNYIPTNIRAGLTKERFTSDGYWTCPTGIFSVLIIASGGGAGSTQGGNGGNGGSGFMHIIY